MKTAIIKYNAGNVQSVLFALERLGAEAIVTDDATELQRAGKIIFPGVGEAGSAMAYLREKQLDTVIRRLEQPVLGICLGMQLLCNHSEESNTECLGIFDVDVQKFSSTDNSYKVPQTGWNNIYDLQGPLFNNVPENPFVYLVHSYYAAVCDNTVAACNYIQPYSAALQKNNFYGVQFHPEKSATAGEQILQNFLSL
jgi:imidazole glycerol-phosphate synthase subunit HisH